MSEHDEMVSEIEARIVELLKLEQEPGESPPDTVARIIRERDDANIRVLAFALEMKQRAAALPVMSDLIRALLRTLPKDKASYSIAMALAPLMILISRLLTPLIWGFSMLAKGVQHLIIGAPEEGSVFLSREEVQKSFEEGETAQDEFNALAAQVFRLKNSPARLSIAPIDPTQIIPSTATISDVRHETGFPSFFLIYHRDPQNIVAIAELRDLLRIDSTKKILEVARPPWFVTQDTSLSQILEQFRRNNQSVALILDSGGRTIGVLTFDQILDAIFGPETPTTAEEKGNLYVQRTISGTMTIEEFNQEFQANFPFHEEETLSDLIVSRLEHAPVKGESVEIDDFYFTVLEPSLRGARTLSVKTVD